MSERAGDVTGPARRWWSVAQADAYLPSLDALLDSVADAVDPEPGEERPFGHASIVLRGLVAVLDEDGVVLRDVQRRLVDFPGRGPDGSVVLFCRVGSEPRVAWWHDPTSGFAGRRSLDHDPPW